MRGKLFCALALLSLLFIAGAARADEIRLKDGTKIIGTIVGFENDSFRVETSYGFALIQKDKVADISIIATKKDFEAKPKASAPAVPSPAQTPSIVPAVAKEPVAPASGSAEANALAPLRAPVNSAASAAAKTEIAAPKIRAWLPRRPRRP